MQILDFQHFSPVFPKRQCNCLFYFMPRAFQQLCCSALLSQVSSPRAGATGVLDISNHMATKHDQVVKCLNTSTSRKRKRFTFKTFSQRVDEIDIDEFHSLQALKPDPKDGSSFFWKALLYWKELNTAEDFVLFYEMIMPLVQTLPQIILHKEHIFSELVGRLQMRAKLSLEPLLMKGYTVLINTWKRNDLLRESVLHYSKCLRVDSIHIIWSEPDPPSDSLHYALSEAVYSNSKAGGNVELVFDLNQEDSLNNRFKNIKDLKSDAVFSVDDDVIFPCESVDLAFAVWRSAPETMVGFVPRMHWLDTPKSNAEHYLYGGWWSVWWTVTYSMVLSKAAFFHKKYLHLYTNRMPQYIRNYVTENRNCEDIAMAFLVANDTGAPPIWVKGRIREIGSTGISSLGSHEETRTRCINDLALCMGVYPWL